MPSATVTITAKAGPNRSLTSGVFTNVTEVDFQLGSNTFSIVSNGGTPQYFDWQSISTVTFTVSGHNGTIVVS